VSRQWEDLGGGRDQVTNQRGFHARAKAGPTLGNAACGPAQGNGACGPAGLKTAAESKTSAESKTPAESKTSPESKTSAESKSPPGNAGARWEFHPRYEGRSNRYLVQVPTDRIGYVNAVLESYEWIARIQTADAGQGILEIHVPEAWDDVFQSACEQLAREGLCVFVGWERGGRSGGRLAPQGAPSAAHPETE